MSINLTSRLTMLMAGILFAFIFIFTSIFSVTFWLHAQNVEKTRTETKLLNMADNIGRNYQGKDLAKSYNNKFFQLSNTISDGEVWIIDKNSLRISGSKNYPKLTYEQLPGACAKDIQQVFTGKNFTSQAFAIFNPNYPYTSGVPIKNVKGQIIGALLINYAMPSFFDSWYDSLGIAIFTALLIYLLLIFITLKLVKRYTMPLRIFNYYLDRLTQGEYQQKLRIKNAKDFELLAQKLNNLAVFLNQQEISTQEQRIQTKTLLLNSAYANYEIARDYEGLLLELKPYLAKYLPKSLTKKLLSFQNKFTRSSADLFREQAPQLIGIKMEYLNILDPLNEVLEDFKPLWENLGTTIEIKNQLALTVILQNGDYQRLRQIFITIFRLITKVLSSEQTISFEYTEDPARYLITISAPSFAHKEDELALNLHFLMAQNLAHLQGMNLRFETQSSMPCYRLIINK